MTRVFVTNRPNYCHKRFAETVGCEFFHVKHFVPDGMPVFSLPVNGMLNAFYLKNTAEVFFAESIMDYYPIYYKRPKGKKIILVAEDTLTKLDKMNIIKKNYILKLFNSCDGFLAISESFKRLLLRYFKKPVRVVYPFPHKEFFHVKATTNSKNVLFIGRDDKTKGFLELVEAIKLLRTETPNWNLYLIGECSKSVKPEEGIHPLGYVKNMEPYMKNCTYFVHPAEAHADYTTVATVFETMNAGIITIISSGLGQAEIFHESRLDNLILPNNKPETIAKKLEELSRKNNRKLSFKLRNISKNFREKKRLKIFRKEFEILLSSI